MAKDCDFVSIHALETLKLKSVLKGCFFFFVPKSFPFPSQRVVGFSLFVFLKHPTCCISKHQELQLSVEEVSWLRNSSRQLTEAVEEIFTAQVGSRGKLFKNDQNKPGTGADFFPSWEVRNLKHFQKSGPRIYLRGQELFLFLFFFSGRFVFFKQAPFFLR